MLRILFLVLLFLVLAAYSVFGQTAPTEFPGWAKAPPQEPTPSLVSNPDPQQTTVIAKRPRVVFLDIPIVPMRKTVHVRRVREGNLNLGSALDPWGKNVIYRINIAPEATISNTDSRLHVAGGFVQGYDEGRRRNDNFLDVSVDRRVWKFSAGLGSFIEGEDVGSAEFLNQESYNDLYSVSMYKLEGPEASNVPTEVYSKKDTGVVDYIIVPVLNTSQGHLERVIEENNLGEPDLELYVVDEFAQKMYVFLGEGLAFRANEISGGIIRRIYFTPTTAERFLEFWGGAASVEEPLFQHP